MTKLLSILFSSTLFTLSYINVLADDIKISPPKNPGGNPIGVPSNKLLGDIITNAITILFTVAAVGGLVYFLWGATEWIFSGGDKEKVSNARRRITHALIGLFLIGLAFFLVRFVGQTVGLDPTGALNLPKLGGP